jgi:MFS family permease
MRNPFRVIVSVSAISTFANWQLGIIIPLFMLEQTGSAATALFTSALRGLPYVVSPVIGVIVDRFDQRLVWTLAQFQQAVCIALLTISPNNMATGALIMFSGVGAAASTITSQFVLLPKLFKKGERDTAVAKLMSILQMTRVGGLLLGGAAISWLGAMVSLAVVVSLYLIASAGCLLLPSFPRTVSNANFLSDLTLGFRWLAKSDIMWLVFTMSAVNLTIGQLESALVTVLAHKDVAAVAISGLLAVGLVASAVSSRLSPVMLPDWAPERRILVSQITVLGAMVLISVHHVATITVGYVILSFATGYNNVVSVTYRQSLIPVEIAGRVNSVTRMIITGAVPLSGFLYALTSRFEGFAFWAPGLVIITVAVTAWGVHTHRRSSSVAVSNAK